VSEVSSDIYDTRVRENKILQRELSNMQKASSNAKEGLSKYVEKLERHFMEDTFSVAESKAVMENLLQEWYALVFFFFFLFQSYLPAKESSVSTHVQQIEEWFSIGTTLGGRKGINYGSH
jgi:hypothetical protein